MPPVVRWHMCPTGRWRVGLHVLEYCSAHREPRVGARQQRKLNPFQYSTVVGALSHHLLSSFLIFSYPLLLSPQLWKFHSSQHSSAWGRFIMNTTHHYALSALHYNITDPEPLPKYEPSSPRAVLETKGLLLKIFPLEIVDLVIEYAEYWPRTTVTTRGRTTKLGNNGNTFIVSLSMFLFPLHLTTFLVPKKAYEVLCRHIASHVSVGISSRNEPQ